MRPLSVTYGSSLVTRTVLGAEAVRITRASGSPMGEKHLCTGNIQKSSLIAAVNFFNRKFCTQQYMMVLMLLLLLMMIMIIIIIIMVISVGIGGL